MTYKTILDFWFREINRDMWFAKSEEFDREIQDRFEDIYLQARQGELFPWRENIYGRLAEIIILDQFSRNMYRDTAQAFATDNLALVLSQEALALPDFEDLLDDEKRFVLMPWMHSESARIHEEAVQLFMKYHLEKPLKYELQHKAIIDQFHRYPHRNKALNRQSTKEELAFLQEFDGF